MVGRSLRSGWIDVRLALGDLELMVELFGSVVVLDVLCSWAAAAGGFWRWDFEWEFENMSFRGTHGGQYAAGFHRTLGQPGSRQPHRAAIQHHRLAAVRRPEFEAVTGGPD